MPSLSCSIPVGTAHVELAAAVVSEVAEASVCGSHPCIGATMLSSSPPESPKSKPPAPAAACRSSSLGRRGARKVAGRPPMLRFAARGVPALSRPFLHGPHSPPMLPTGPAELSAPMSCALLNHPARHGIHQIHQAPLAPRWSKPSPKSPCAGCFDGPRRPVVPAAAPRLAVL